MDQSSHATCYADCLPDKCEVCDRLWAELADANSRLLAVVEKKYENKEHGPDLEARMHLAIEDRQRLKEQILSHECGAHATMRAYGAHGHGT